MEDHGCNIILLVPSPTFGHFNVLIHHQTLFEGSSHTHIGIATTLEITTSMTGPEQSSVKRLTESLHIPKSMQL